MIEVATGEAFPEAGVIRTAPIWSTGASPPEAIFIAAFGAIVYATAGLECPMYSTIPLIAVSVGLIRTV
jgi:hypothetical protein